MSRVLQGIVYAKMGDTAQALGNVAQFGGRSSASCAFVLCGPSRALMGLRREALDTLKAAVENGFFNLPMIEFLTRPGMSFHILRNDPDFHAIRADLARRIDALRSRY